MWGPTPDCGSQSVIGDSLSITPIYAIPLVALFVALLLRVVYLRNKLKVGIGDGGDRTLAKAIRAHGNFAEIVPLALLLMLLAELAGASAALLHSAGSLLIAGRAVHAFGLSRHSGYSVGRFLGTILTLASMVTYAVAAVV